MAVNAAQLRALLVSVVAIRIGALLLTFYAISAFPLKFYESNPVVSPVFGSLGSLGATLFYTVILLFAMLLLYDSVAKTHPKFYGVVFVMYSVVLLISLFDLANDAVIVLGAAR